MLLKADIVELEVDWLFIRESKTLYLQPMKGFIRLQSFVIWEMLFRKFSEDPLEMDRMVGI